VKVPNSEDRASYAVPESCGACREVRREALTGEPVGQPLSRESFIDQGADAVSVAEGNTLQSEIARTARTLRGLRTWHAGRLLAREPGDLLSGRKWQCHETVRIGKARSRSR
jgi:hypothetical protein